ncbi:MAG: hypothetical protein ACE5GJ_13475 [Gemmatimonadota bacterium]
MPGSVGFHLPVEELSNAARYSAVVGGIRSRSEWNVLRIAEFGIGLGIPVLVATDLGGLVPLGEGAEDGLLHRCAELHAGFLGGCSQRA